MPGSFDGVDDKLECADESAFDWERTSPMSFAAWVRKPSITGNCILGKAQTSGPQRGIAFNTEAGAGGVALSFHLVSESGGTNHLFVQSVDYFQPFFWIHAVATYDGSEAVAGVKLYGNGVLLGVGSSVDNLTGTILTDNPFRVAGHQTGGGEFWAGDAGAVIADNTEWSASEVALLARLGNYLKPPSQLLSAAPELWLPLSARPGDSSFDLNDYANNHDASTVGAPTAVAAPEVLLDWGNSGVLGTSFTTTTSFTKACAAPCQGMVVGIAQTTASTDRITSVTCDGFPMTRVRIAQDTAGEPGAVYAYFINRPLAAGDHTIEITVSAGTEAKRAWTCGLISDSELEVVTSGVVQGDAANPSHTLATPPSFAGIVFNFLYSGLPTPSNAVPVSGYTQLGGNHDFGAQIGGAFAANKEGANIACGWTSASDDVAMIALAIGAKGRRSSVIRADALHRAGRW